MGAITAHPSNPTGEVTNEIDFDDEGFTATSVPEEGHLYRNQSLIPDVDVAAGRQTIRNLLGRGKLSTQFDAHTGTQMEFPGMKGKYYGKKEF